MEEINKEEFEAELKKEEFKEELKKIHYSKRINDLMNSFEKGKNQNGAVMKLDHVQIMLSDEPEPVKKTVLELLHEINYFEA